MTAPIVEAPTTTRALMDALMAHYRKPGMEGGDGEVLLPEVVAPGSNRRCDLLRIGLWPSRGLGIDVHELKVSRSDWQRELSDPAKADAWWAYCSRFWIVAPPKMIRPEEMPPGWGLMEPPTNPNHRRFRVIVQPEQRTPNLTVQLLAALVTRTENLHSEHMRQIQQEHRRTIDDAIRAERRRLDGPAIGPDLKERLNVLARLEEVLGAEICKQGWGGRLDVEEVAVALREYTQDHIALQRRAQSLDYRVRRLRGAAETVLKQLAEAEPGEAS